MPESKASSLTYDVSSKQHHASIDGATDLTSCRSNKGDHPLQVLLRNLDEP
jgi:hypothetical protein